MSCPTRIPPGCFLRQALSAASTKNPFPQFLTGLAFLRRCKNDDSGRISAPARRRRPIPMSLYTIGGPVSGVCGMVTLFAISFHTWYKWLPCRVLCCHRTSAPGRRSRRTNARTRKTVSARTPDRSHAQTFIHFDNSGETGTWLQALALILV